MDDRKRSIDELEKARQESHSSLDALLEHFGENLYARTKEMQVDYEDIIQYNVYLQDIAESNSAIAKVEEKNRRFKELEETISFKEQEEKERSKELAAAHRRLGKVLLENSLYDDFTSFFREQADSLKAKLDSLESRIKELDNKGDGNVFTWIGKSAQGLVLKSFLSKAQESQEQLYLNVGERFSSRDAVLKEDDAIFREEVEQIRNISRTAQEEIAVLKDEKRMLLAGFGIDGNPQKQIQSLKNHINQVRENLTNLYRVFGAQASGIMDDEIQPERKYFIDTIVTAEDGEIIGRAVRLNSSILECEKNIVKLKASLAIDEESAKIEKYHRAIIDKKNRIADLEGAILELEQNVSESEAIIKELRKKL